MSEQDWPKIYISGVGMLTPLGNGELTAAAVRAEVSAYQVVETPDFFSETLTLSMIPEPVIPALNEYFETDFEDDQLTEIGHLENRAQRMLHTLLRALDDLKQDSSVSVVGAPILLGLPEAMPTVPAFQSVEFLKALLGLSPIPLDQNNSAVFCNGRSSTLYAIQHAVSLISSKQHACVLVGGVDSFLDMDLLEILDKDQRLLSAGNMTGFVAGEGAAILALIDEELLLNNQIETTLVQVGKVGIAEESGHRYSEETYKGEGLAQAFQVALEEIKQPVSSVMAGFNGDEIMAKEWGVAVIRNQQSFNEDFNVMHPADCVGDLGAAAGALQLGLASIGISKGYIKSPCLVWSSSEYESRSAVCVHEVIEVG